MRVAGEGSDVLPRDADNLVVRAFRRLCDEAGAPMPAGLRIDCDVAVPLSSGLGSSASAIVAGLLGANELLGRPVGAAAILALATEVEGHPDNVAAALDGGLVVVVNGEDGLLTERIEVRPDRGGARGVAARVLDQGRRAPSCRPTWPWPTRSTTWAAPRSWSRRCAGATSSCSARRWTTGCIRRCASSTCPAAWPPWRRPAKPAPPRSRSRARGRASSPSRRRARRSTTSPPLWSTRSRAWA